MYIERSPQNNFMLLLQFLVVYLVKLSASKPYSIDGRWMIMSMEHWWNNNDRGKPKYSK
jgi:hypothetical protein